MVRIARIGDTVIAVTALLGGFLATNLYRMPVGLTAFLEMRLTIKNLILVAGYAVAWRVICRLVNLYDEQRIRSLRAAVWPVVAAVTMGSAVALIFPFISVTRAFSYLAILHYWIVAVTGMLAFRAGLRALLSSRSPRLPDVLIVGSGPRALKLYHALCANGANTYHCVGFVDSPHHELEPEVRDRLVADLNGFEEILMRQAIDEVLIALPARSRYADIQRTIEICERGGVPARYPADVFQHRRSDKQQIGDEHFMAVPAGVSADDGRLFVKRCLDLVLGAVALAGAAPVLAVAALAIRLTSPGPVVFAQERYGLNKRRFKMYKLRTMITDAEVQQVLLESRNEATGPVFKIRQDPRITRVGRVLRRFSIDELPQLVNVIRGEMSLVGPRPLPVRDVSRFSEPALMRRFSVYPGLTGLWQVSGRCELAFDDWIRLDLQYIDEWSLGLDLRILLRTLPTVFQGTGAV